MAKLKNQNKNQSLRVKLAAQHVKMSSDSDIKTFKDLKRHMGGDMAYHLNAGAMFGFRDIGREKTMQPALFDFPVNRYSENLVFDKIEEAEEKGVPYDIVLLSEVEANKVDTFRTYKEFKEHISAPHFS